MGRSISADEFEKFYRSTARDLLAYVRRRTSGDAEDIVAEAYVVAWRRRADLPSAFLRRAWLFGVARTLLKAQGRLDQRNGELLCELAEQPTETDTASENTGSAAIVTAALNRLAPADREILRLATWEGLTPAEIAVALKIRPGAARVRLHRARQAFASDPAVKAVVENPAAPSEARSAELAH